MMPSVVFLWVLLAVPDAAYGQTVYSLPGQNGSMKAQKNHQEWLNRVRRQGEDRSRKLHDGLQQKMQKNLNDIRTLGKHDSVDVEIEIPRQRGGRLWRTRLHGARRRRACRVQPDRQHEMRV